MHELLGQVLNQRDLSKAGDLFTVDDVAIVASLSDVVSKIQEITSQASYLQNDNDQSVVEICIARLTSAIRETSSIELHAPALVRLLESSLSQNLKPFNRDEDPPHAKIAADVISCIFLNYTKKEVMKLAVPVAVKFLHKGNRELSRNLSSYLSLAALDNADLLAKHIQPIIDSVISGNYTLARVLPQIYAVNKEPIHDHVMALVSLLPLCDNPEKLSLLNLFGLIAKHAPSLLEPSLPQLIECLPSPIAAMPVLHVFADMASFKAQPFAEHFVKLKQIVEQQPATLGLVVRIIGYVGHLNQERARDALNYMVPLMSQADHTLLSAILKEVKIICDFYPALLKEYMNEIGKYSDTTASTARIYVQQIKQNYGMQIKPPHINQSHSGITVVKLGTSKHDLVFPNSPPSKVSFTSNRTGLNLSTPKICANNKYTNHSLTKLPGITQSRSGSSGGINMSMTRLNSNQAIYRSVTAIGPRSNIPTTRISSCGVTVTTTGTGIMSLPSKSTSGSLSVFQEEPSDSSISHHASSHFHSDKPNSLGSSHSGINAIHIKPCVSTSVNASSPTLPSPMSSNGGPVFLFSSTTISSQPHGGTNSSMTIVPTPALTPTPPPPSPPLPLVGSVGVHSINLTGSSSSSHFSKAAQSQRMSAFEPYPMRDAVQHFCEKHLDKIKQYMQKIFLTLPLPVKCTIEERKNRKHAKLHFACQGKGEHCLYSRTFFTLKTRCPRIWIHLMFLALQARSPTALSTREQSVSSLKTCWDILKSDGKSFLTLVFSPFPSSKDQEIVIHELRNARFFDVFVYNEPLKHWRCFLCNHPDRAIDFLQDTEPVIEGQLKEKKGKWKIFRRWRTRYFTLSGAHLSYRGSSDTDIQPINVSQIQSVKAISARGARSIPKAFEIFTTDKTYVLKAKDSKNTEQWVQCLSIVVAHSHSKDGCH
ncbi:hypothetical protein CHUAL_009064 [Chamberlinius hualienensis]